MTVMHWKHVDDIPQKCKWVVSTISSVSPRADIFWAYVDSDVFLSL